MLVTRVRWLRTGRKRIRYLSTVTPPDSTFGRLVLNFDTKKVKEFEQKNTNSVVKQSSKRPWTLHLSVTLETLLLVGTV